MKLPALLLLCLSAWAADPEWRARVAGKNEPGDRLTIRGRVWKHPGGAPAAGAQILVYQTDANGIYSREKGHPRDTSRLRGRLVAGPNGEYEIVTVKPGHYPGGTVPAHIHVNLVEPGREPREVSEFFFEGDKALSGSERGPLLKLKLEKPGHWVAAQDFALHGGR